MRQVYRHIIELASTNGAQIRHHVSMTMIICPCGRRFHDWLSASHVIIFNKYSYQALSALERIIRRADHRHGMTEALKSYGLFGQPRPDAEYDHVAGRPPYRRSI